MRLLPIDSSEATKLCPFSVRLGLRLMRLGEHEDPHQEVQAAEQGGEQEWIAGGHAASQAAQERAGDEPEAEAGIHVAESPGPFLGAGDVGDVGGGHRQVGPGHPGECATDVKDREERREPHGQVVDRRHAERDEQDGPAAETITQAPEHGREQELHEGIDRHEVAEAAGDPRLVR